MSNRHHHHHGGGHVGHVGHAGHGGGGGHGELSTGKSILVCAVVLGCFAVLWPKIFYPMLFGSSSSSSSARSFEGTGRARDFLETSPVFFMFYYWARKSTVSNCRILFSLKKKVSLLSRPVL